MSISNVSRAVSLTPEKLTRCSDNGTNFLETPTRLTGRHEFLPIVIVGLLSLAASVLQWIIDPARSLLPIARNRRTSCVDMLKPLANPELADCCEAKRLAT
jgi:hypothetical protein